MKKGAVLTFLIAILVLGGFLRVLHMNDESLWLDEGVTYYNSSAEDYGGVWDKATKLDQSPPGYYFLMHNYLEFFGENEFGFRLISVIFGVLSILFLYLIMAELFDEEVGLFAAFLLAIAPFHIGFSIEARMYVLLSLEALMGFYFLYKAATHEGRGYLWWLMFTLLSVVGMYTHNFYAVVLLALAFVFIALLFLVEKKFPVFLMGFLSVILIVLSYIPWINSLLHQLKVDRYWMADVGLLDLKNYFLDFSNQNSYAAWGFLALILIGGLWVLFNLRALDYKKRLINSIVLVIFVVVGIGAPFLYSLFFEPVLKIRYLVYLYPIFIGLVSLGIYVLRRFSLIFPVFVFAGFVYLFMPWKVSAYPLEIGEDFRGLAEVVSDEPAPLVVHTPSIAHVINFYNNGDFDIFPYPNSDDLRVYNIDDSNKKEFLAYVNDFDSFYLAVSHSHENPGGLLYVWSDGKCKSNTKRALYGVDLWLFEACK